MADGITATTTAVTPVPTLPGAEASATGALVVALPATTLASSPMNITVPKDVPVQVTANADGSTTVVIDMPDVTTALPSGTSATDDGKKTIQVPAGNSVKTLVNADGSTMVVIDVAPVATAAAAPALGDLYARRAGSLNTQASNYVWKVGVGGDLIPFSPDTYSLATSYETVAPFTDPTRAGGGSNGLVAKVAVGIPFVPQDGSAATSSYEVGYRLFGPEIWIGGSTATPFTDAPDDGEKGKWAADQTSVNYHVRGALRFFAKDYKNDTDLPFFNLSAELSGPEFGLGTFDSFSGTLNFNPAIHSPAADWFAYEPRSFPYVYENDVDGDGKTTAEELAQLDLKGREAQRLKQLQDPAFKARVEAFEQDEKRKQAESKTGGKIEDAYLLTSIGMSSTRLDAEGFLTDLSLDAAKQREEGMAFNNSFSAGTTFYLGLGDRAINGQRPYMLSLSGSYASGWDSNPAYDTEYNPDLTYRYTQAELTPDTGDWALEARFNFKNKIDYVDSTGTKVKVPETPHSMIVNDPTASIAVSLASSSSYNLGGWHYPSNYIGGDTNYREIVESDSLVLGLTGTLSQYSRSIGLLGGNAYIKPKAGITYDLSQGIEDKDRFAFNAALSIGFKKKGKL